MHTGRRRLATICIAATSAALLVMPPAAAAPEDAAVRVITQVHRPGEPFATLVVAAFTCTVVAEKAVAIAIEQCTYSSHLQTVDAPTHTTTGPVATTGAPVLSYAAEETICYRVTAQLSNGVVQHLQGCAAV